MADVHSRFLAAGINMVSSSISGMVNPEAHVDRAMIEKISGAANEGKSSYFSSGIEPGFMSDTLPLTLSGMSQDWKTIRVQEILNYSTWIPNEVDKLMGDVLGFGRSMDYVPLLFRPGHLTYVWGGPVTLMARALGVTLDEVREKVWRHPADESFEVKGYQTIEKGTAEAFRFELQGIVDGREALVLEHVTRLRQGTAPQWDSGAEGDGYYVYIDGNPNMTLHMAVTGPDGDHHTGGILATATRLVNAIPYVCDAKPGLLTALDLPMIVGRGLYRPNAKASLRTHKKL
jgi:4-hydroxy-tetrahydrodipicolinate reductase